MNSSLNVEKEGREEKRLPGYNKEKDRNKKEEDEGKKERLEEDEDGENEARVKDERVETAWVRQRWERPYLRSLSVFSSPSNRLCRTREGRKKMAHSTRALSRRAQGSNV